MGKVIRLLSEGNFDYPLFKTFEESTYRIKTIMDTVAEHFPDINPAYVSCGTSGAFCLAIILQINPNMPVMLVNPGESAHRKSKEYINKIDGTTPVFIDDVIASGNTMATVADLIKLDKFEVATTLFCNRFGIENFDKHYRTLNLITYRS